MSFVRPEVAVVGKLDLPAGHSFEQDRGVHDAAGVDGDAPVTHVEGRVGENVVSLKVTGIR